MECKKTIPLCYRFQVKNNLPHNNSGAALWFQPLLSIQLIIYVNVLLLYFIIIQSTFPPHYSQSFTSLQFYPYLCLNFVENSILEHVTTSYYSSFAGIIIAGLYGMERPSASGTCILFVEGFVFWLSFCDRFAEHNIYVWRFRRSYT